MLVIVVHSFCCCSSFILFFIFVVVLHFFASTSSLTLPWKIAGFLHPFFTFSPAHRRVICSTFIFNLSEIFFHSFTASATVLGGHFHPQAFFTLRSFTYLLPAFVKSSPGSRQFFLEVCRASYWSSKHRPGPSAFFIHSYPQSSYSERFIFKLYHIFMNCLWWKFNLSAPYSFRILFTCSKSYVKTIKKHFEQDLLLLITASMNVILKKQSGVL